MKCVLNHRLSPTGIHDVAGMRKVWLAIPPFCITCLCDSGPVTRRATRQCRALPLAHLVFTERPRTSAFQRLFMSLLKAFRKPCSKPLIPKVARALVPTASPLSRNLARAKVYSKPERNLCLAQKYTSVQWQNSEVSAARDAPVRDRPSLMGTLGFSRQRRSRQGTAHRSFRSPLPRTFTCDGNGFGRRRGQAAIARQSIGCARHMQSASLIRLNSMSCRLFFRERSLACARIGACKMDIHIKDLPQKRRTGLLARRQTPVPATGTQQLIENKRP